MEHLSSSLVVSSGHAKPEWLRYDPIQDKKFSNPKVGAEHYCKLQMDSEIRDRGFNPWGKSYGQVLGLRTWKMIQVLRCNPELDINYMIWELENGLEDYC